MTSSTNNDTADIQSNNSKPVDSPKVESKKSGFPIIKVLGFTAASIFLTTAITKWWCCFGVIDENLYATTFYSWRVNNADKLMWEETWRFIRDNKYNEKSEKGLLAPFIEKAQKGDRPLLFDMHPEHYPRGQKFYFTHTGGDDYNLNDAFLNFRKDMVEKTGHEVPEAIKNGSKEISSKEKLFWTKKDKKSEWSENDYRDLRQNHKEVYNFMVPLTKFLDKLRNNEFEPHDEEKKKEINKSILEIVKAAKIEIKKEDEDKFAENVVDSFGKVNSSLLQNFFYSRIFYLVFLSTLDVKDLQNDTPITTFKKNNPDKNEDHEEVKEMRKELQKNSAARAATVGRCLAQLWIRVYKHGLTGPDEKFKDKGIQKFFYEKFGPAKADFVDETENINLIVEKLKERYPEGN